MPALRGNLAFLHTQVSAHEQCHLHLTNCVRAARSLFPSTAGARLLIRFRNTGAAPTPAMVAQEEAQEEACAEGADGCHCCGNSNTAAAGQCQHRAVRPRAASKPKSRRRTMPGEGQGLGGKAPGPAP
eukprot:CAMPEP_0180714456 /NCGR_PEP_ID=MMETSP1038_2-20121128/12431_1 /TAXON_ID=632150 /ORGANISM="Azadinium spinosum, Strain 3D9" /LENGTH=127 /DNA_ID=CAMNT_0022746821 /DNA_START=242 /DNA_END=621 /DNA_ORIENTATION=-